MKKLVLLGVLIGLSVSVHASMEIAKNNNCLACHAQDKKVIGPSFNDVKEKYKDDKGALEKLTKKVKSGGSGVWGVMPMPANPQINDKDLNLVLTYILGKK